MSSDGSRSAPCPSLIWIDPRTWMRPTPARAARLLPQRSAIQIRDGFGSARRSRLGMDSAALSPLADPCITVGAAEEVHPLPTANAHQHGRRPPSRPPYGRRLAAHRAPPSKIEAHHAPASPIHFREIQIWLRYHFSWRFRSHWRAAPTRSHSRCCAPPHALRASASAPHRTQPRNPSREIDETHRTQPRSPS
jgi:hypothetical protein